MGFCTSDDLWKSVESILAAIILAARTPSLSDKPQTETVLRALPTRQRQESKSFCHDVMINTPRTSTATKSWTEQASAWSSLLEKRKRKLFNVM
jgi:hypothetical protein